MASFGYEQNGKWHHYCGGAIISDSTLITANHCFNHPNVRPHIKQMTKIRLGDQNLNDGIDDTNTYEIEKIVPHPESNGRAPQYDLAIVYTKTKIQFNDRIKPICIPTKPYDEANRYANDEVKFSGWGFFNSSRVFSNDLREAAFKVLSQSQCFSDPLYKPRIEYKDVIFCAGNEVICIDNQNYCSQS